jgi:hypothetical protein
MKKARAWRNVIKLAGGLVAAGVFGLLRIAPTHAEDLNLMTVINGAYRGQGQPAELFAGPDAIIPQAINLMLFIVGVIAIFMLIFGGIRYVISGGAADRVKDAKNTILYAIIGLVVAILGYAIVQWVISVVGAGGASTSV